jgi:zinc/manganese transport system permease protein
MFSGFMSHAWEAGTLVAIAAGVVGFFVVLRGSTFAAHAVPLSSFAGAAGANLVGAAPIAGLLVFAPVSALAIGWLDRRRRGGGVATALVVAAMLGLGSLFLSFSVEYEAAIYGLLFGQVFGVSAGQVWLTAGLAAGALAAVAVLYRPLLLSSVSAEIAESRGGRTYLLDLGFLVLVALVTTITVPIVGAFLMFSLMVGPSAAARTFAPTPVRAIVVGVGLALVTVWTSLALSYLTNWPLGFFVGVLGALCYVVARVVRLLRR